MSSPPRRNDPCPCGSGLRFKECHGKLEAAAPALAPRIQRALQLHQAGQVAEAERLYRDVLVEEPRHPVATHYLGLAAWHRGDRIEAERLMRESVALDGNVPDFHNNLGLLLRDTHRLDEAVACYRRALEIEPRWMDAHSNLGLALEAAGRNEDAISAYAASLALAPDFAVGHQNMALALLTAGRLREALPHYRWRLAAQGLARTAPDASARPWPQGLANRRFALHAEQGLGDALFFLRFAPEAVRRGAQLAFRGDPRLHPILARTGLFELGLEDESAAAPEAEAAFLGDLPWLLGIDEPQKFPPPLPLAADPERVRTWRAKLVALGPAPVVALTWRAGTQGVAGPARNLSKEIPPTTLGQRLRDAKATWISVQRLPGAGELEALKAALGQPVHDASYANGDLEEILALMSVVDDYVGVSNTNTHLRAGTGGAMRVLVPHPPEWRWGLQGDRSPWFPTAVVTRQLPNGRWD